MTHPFTLAFLAALAFLALFLCSFLAALADNLFVAIILKRYLCSQIHVDSQNLFDLL